MRLFPPPWENRSAMLPHSVWPWGWKERESRCRNVLGLLYSPRKLQIPALRCPVFPLGPWRVQHYCMRFFRQKDEPRYESVDRTPSYVRNDELRAKVSAPQDRIKSCKAAVRKGGTDEWKTGWKDRSGHGRGTGNWTGDGNRLCSGRRHRVGHGYQPGSTQRSRRGTSPDGLPRTRCAQPKGD